MTRQNESTWNDIQRMPRFTTAQLEQRLMRDVFAQVPPVDDSRYGEPQKEEIDGMKVTVNYGGQEVQYVVPKDYAWTAGVGAITIGKAYRVFDEGKETAHLREVRDPSELESAASGYFQRIMEVLNRYKK